MVQENKVTKKTILKAMMKGLKNAEKRSINLKYTIKRHRKSPFQALQTISTITGIKKPKK